MYKIWLFKAKTRMHIQVYLDSILAKYAAETFMKKRYLLLSLAIGISLSMSLYASENIVINHAGLYPEGISFDAQEKIFYVSSVAKGEIWKVNQKGETALFAKNKKFPSVIGLLVDEKRNRLIACIADPGVGINSTASSKGRLAGVVIYDLSSKRELAYYNLSAVGGNKHHFANDVAIDDDGNIYVTDSFSPVIYKIDPIGKIEIFAQYAKWNVAAGKFGLNGIVYHPDGFLIVAHYDSGKLYKIELNNPLSIKEVVPSNPSKKWKISGFDGLLLLDNKTLIAVNVDPSGRENGNAVYRLLSNDNWDSFKLNAVMPTRNTYPTTLTKNNDGIFVLHSKLLELFMNKQPASKTFEIEKVLFSVLEN